MGVHNVKISVLLTILTFICTVSSVWITSKPLQRTTSGDKFSRRPNVVIRPRATTGEMNANRYVLSGLGDINSVKLSMSNDIDSEDPPPHSQVTKMARYIVSQSLWTSFATISSRSPTTGSPFATILSISDGTKEKSTGIPYFYMTPQDLSVMDLQVNPNASIVMSLAQGTYCDSHKYDPEDPRCAIVSITGHIVKLKIGSSEEKFAKAAIFYKHPIMSTWPKSHAWFCAKLEIVNILVRDYFGGVSNINIDEYFNATLPTY